MPAESTPSVYADLGVKRVICARSSSTVLGGSILSPTVRAAMEEANRIYVGMPELLDRAGESIAELIGAEAAYPTPGCFAAITLGVSGVMTGGAPDLVARLPDTSGLKNEFLIQKCARYQYDRSVTVSGARMIEVGDDAQTTPNQLAQAIGPSTGGIVYAAHQEGEPGILPLSEVVSIAKDAGVAVIVDAAYQVYPLERITELVNSGADLICFSAKYMGGPNSAGFLSGNSEAVKAAALNGFMAFETEKNRNMGRGYKIDRQEVVAIVAVLKEWLEMDHSARLTDQDRKFQVVAEGLAGLPHVEIEQGWYDRYCSMEMKITLDEEALGRTAASVEQAMREGDPSIWLWLEGTALKLGVDTLLEGEEQILARRLREELAS